MLRTFLYQPIDMMKNRYASGLLLLLHLWCNVAVANGNNNLPGYKDIESQVKRVISWQIDNFSYSASGNLHDNGVASWAHSVLYIGLSEWSTLREEESADYWEWLFNIGTQSDWNMNGIYPYHADEFCVGQFFATMYGNYKQDKMISGTLERMERVMADARNTSMSYRNKEAWTWCDALFMAPPLYARMSDLKQDKRYFEFMDKEFRKTYDYLFDPTEELFYRDDSYFNKTEANGKKIFWGRGNGWAIAGITNILKTLPADSEYRSYYEDIYQSLALSLIKLQDKKGAWHASLLDPDSYPAPETSCTALITYALVYGLNNRLLTQQEAYIPAIKAWNVLCEAIHENGKLGWVQPIGQDPKNVTKDMTATFGVGAFLLAATEMYKLAKSSDTGIQEDRGENIFTRPETKVTIYNEQGIIVTDNLLGNRTLETITQKSHFPQGLYMIVLQNGNKRKVTKYVIL